MGRRSLEEGRARTQQNAQQGRGYLDDYFRGGQRQIPFLEQIISQYGDPSNFYDSLMQDYMTSPEAEREIGDLTEHGLDMAYASGTSGSANRQELMRQAGDVRQRDRRNYLNDILGIGDRAIGVSQGMYSGGLQAGQGINQNFMNEAQMQNQLDIEQSRLEENRRNTRRNMLATLIGTGAGAASYAFNRK